MDKKEAKSKKWKKIWTALCRVYLKSEKEREREREREKREREKRERVRERERERGNVC